jgi:AraC family transcriptional regulator of adaptative response/methylated-DNA-[protein]-cysteine methyltransferase
MKNAQTIAKTVDWIATQDNAPSLESLAQRYDYDPAHIQNILGFMPCQHVRDLKLTHFKNLDAAYEAGLSGQGRLHDLFLKIETMTSGCVKDRGKNIRITYGFAPTFMGELMVAKTDKGICWLGFQVDESREKSTQRMMNYWPKATLIEGDVSLEIEKIESFWRHYEEHSDEAIQNGDYGSGLPPPFEPGASSFSLSLPRNDKLRLDLYGTNMQLQVWQALLKIPFGAVTDYKAIAHSIGKPKAARAVGNAVGMNPVSLLIPCHRVIQSTGIVNNYGWGSTRKKIILGIEGNTLLPREKVPECNEGG